MLFDAHTIQYWHFPSITINGVVFTFDVGPGHHFCPAFFSLPETRSVICPSSVFVGTEMSLLSAWWSAHASRMRLCVSYLANTVQSSYRKPFLSAEYFILIHCKAEIQSHFQADQVITGNWTESLGYASHLQQACRLFQLYYSPPMFCEISDRHPLNLQKRLPCPD